MGMRRGRSRARGRLAESAFGDDGFCVVRIADDGPGIPVERREDAFRPFYRLDESRNQDNGNSGLGLAIARWIVDLHGGDIHPERREPHGCRMVVTLPTAA